MRTVTILFLGAATLAACSGGEQRQQRADANAAAAGFRPPSVTSRLDFGGMVERRFRSLDRDGNNYVTPDEFPKTDSRITNFDRDGDGRISNEEYGDAMLALFDRNDANKDGTVTSDERELSRQRQQQR